MSVHLSLEIKLVRKMKATSISFTILMISRLTLAFIDSKKTAKISCYLITDWTIFDLR